MPRLSLDSFAQLRFDPRVISVLVPLTALLAAAPKLAVAGLTPVEVSAERAEYFTEQLGLELTNAGAEVTTPDALRALLGLERQRQLMGCSDSSCVAELSNAMGADGVVIGQLAKNDGRFRLSAKVLSSKSGKTVRVASIEAPSDSELQAGLRGCARQLLGLPESSAGPWVVGGVGAGLAVVGSVFLFSAVSAHDALGRRGSAALSYGQAVETAANGSRDQLIGSVGLATGLTALAVGIVWYLVSPRQPALLEGLAE